MQFNILKFVFLFSMSFTLSTANAQCDANTTICSQGTAGPFGFTNPGTPVSSCLDFYGPGYAYIVLYITQSGPLEMLIEGDATSGFLDVSIFNIPQNQDPCTAIQNSANEISCNYASAASGCNQIGNYFSCPSSVSSPYVTAGDKLMIVVENWSGASNEFTLQLAPPPAAQTGPADPTITPVATSVFTGDAPFQMLAADQGGTWSGPGITSDGMFDPGATGSGVFTVHYEIGSAPCNAMDSYTITVNSQLAVEMKRVELICMHDMVKMEWETVTQEDCDYFRVERSRDGEYYEEIGTVQGHGTTNEAKSYDLTAEHYNTIGYYRLVEVDYDGTETVYGPYSADCKSGELEIKPNPTEDFINVTFNGFQANATSIYLFDQAGRMVKEINETSNGQQKISMGALVSGVYTLVVSDSYSKKAAKVVKL